MTFNGSIGLIAIFSGSEDQNIVLSAILFFQCMVLLERLNYKYSHLTRLGHGLKDIFMIN